MAGVGIHYWWMDGLGWFLMEVFFRETEYATRYSEIGFRRINIGSHTGEVIQTLGPPLEIRDYDCGGCGWYYTRGRIRDGSGLGFNCAYTERDLSVSNGVVTRKHHGFFFD